MRTVRQVAISCLVEIGLFLLIFRSFNMCIRVHMEAELLVEWTVPVINLLPLSNSLFTFCEIIFTLYYVVGIELCTGSQEGPYISNSLFS